MGLIKNILIVGIIGLILFLVISHFFLRTNIIWDSMSQGNTTLSTRIQDIEVPTTIFSGNMANYPATISSIATNITKSSFAENALKTGLIVPSSKFPTIMSSNIMFSIWFFIDEYTTQIGKYKYISTLAGYKNTYYYPTLFVFLTQNSNNLGIGVVTQNTSNNPNVNFYYVPNISLQKWNCLIISITDRTMDIYLEGKLINSFILQGYYISASNTSLYIGNNEANYFDGFITRARFANGGANPVEAYSIYKEGINTSFAGNFLNKYKLKVGLYEYNNKVGGFSI